MCHAPKDQKVPLRATNRALSGPSHPRIAPANFSFELAFSGFFLGPVPQHGLLGALSLQDIFATGHKFHYFQFQTVLNSTTMSPSKLPHAISLIVDHLWLVFQPILVAFPPGLLFAESSDDDNDDDAAPYGGPSGDDAIPQVVHAAVLPPALVAPALPVAQASPVAVLPVAPPSVAIEPRWPAIPATLPQTVSFHFEVGTQVPSPLLPPRIS